jgi:hypothetical protein
MGNRRGVRAPRRPASSQARLLTSVAIGVLGPLSGCSPAATTGAPGAGDGQSPLLVLILFVLAVFIVVAAAAIFRRRRGPGGEP